MTDTSVKATAVTSWEHGKTADKEKLGTVHVSDGENGQKLQLRDDITFTLNEYSKNYGYGSEAVSVEKDLPGDIWTKKFTVTDTMKFPAGMYIASEEDLKKALSFEGFDSEPAVTPILENGKIVGATITYKKENGDSRHQMSYWTGKVTLDKNKVLIDVDESSLTGGELGAITNQLDTVYTDVFENTHALNPAGPQVSVPVKLPRKVDFSAEGALGKTIQTIVQDKNLPNTDIGKSSNVYEGAYLIYQVSAKNNGEDPTDITITDQLPVGVEIADYTEFKTALESGSNRIDGKHPYDDQTNILATVTNNIGVKEGNGSAEIKDGTPTWTFKNVAAGHEVKGYLVVKVTGDQDTKLTNTMKVENASASVSVNQKKRMEDTSIQKTASVNNLLSKTFNYTITVENTGTKEASGWTVEDLLPSELKAVDASQVVTKFENVNDGEGSCGKPSVDGGNKLTVKGVKLPLKGKLIITIPVTIKDDSYEGLSKLENKATVTKDKVTHEAKVELEKPEAGNLTVNKRASAQELQPGDKFTYTIEVSNYEKKADGKKHDMHIPSDNPLKIEDSLPEGVELLGDIKTSVTYKKNDAAKFENDKIVPSYDSENRKLSVELSGLLKVDAKLTFTVKCKVKEDILKDGESKH